MIALIPARGGSKRLPRKNIKPLGGHPLLAYTIAAAQDAGVFEWVVVSTEDDEIAEVAIHYGAQVLTRPPEFASDAATDAQWMQHAASVLGKRALYQWALLRPTSPFRTADTIRRAWRVFRQHDTADSLRAVEPVTQHPGKMWTWQGDGYPIRPLLDQRHPDGTPWHSSPTQSLPTYYVQNASLEMGWGANLWTHGTIHGRKVAPFFTEGYEGIDINSESDWTRAEALIASGAAILPPVSVAAVSADLWAV